jgi:hypothetical protein
MAVDHEHVRLFESGTAFFCAHMMFETAMHGIILQLVREIVGIGGYVHDGNHIDAFAEQTLIHERLKHETSDTSEPINCNFDCHNFILCLLSVGEIILSQNRNRILSTRHLPSMKNWGSQTNKQHHDTDISCNRLVTKQKESNPIREFYPFESAAF